MAYIITHDSIKPDIDKTAYLAENATIIGNVKIGAGASIWFNTVLRGDDSTITVGNYTNIQDNSTVHPEINQPMEIGDYVLIGHNAIVHCAKIGAGCLIGMGAILLSYSEIGENCIIGAGTLITQHKVIPPNSLVYGNPAKVIRTLTEEEIQQVREDVMGYYKNGQAYKKNQQE